jgi:tRNA A37 methylthiotransferase MiaB
MTLSTIRTKTACIAFANGCNRAEAEIAIFSEYLRSNGYVITDRPDGVDFLLVSACGFDAAAEAISLKLLSGMVHRANPRTKIVIVGCLPGIRPNLLQSRFGERMTPLALNDLEKLDQIIQAKIPFSTIRKDMNKPRSIVRGTVNFSPDIIAERFKNTKEVTSSTRKAFTCFQRALAQLPTNRDVYDKWIVRVQGVGRLLSFERPEPWIPAIIVARGCKGHCAYCAIKQASGPLVSVPLVSVIQQAKVLLEEEKQCPISLIAGDLGAYGQDIGLTVCDLLEGIFSLDGSFKLILNDFGPEWLIRYSDRLRGILSKYQEKIDHLKLPVQSGSDRILERMARRYTRGELIENVSALKREAPGLPISTHIMVGFPGETDEDFQESISLLDVLKFDYVTVFKYSDRPGMPASNFPDKVPERVKRNRLRVLRRRRLK